MPANQPYGVMPDNLWGRGVIVAQHDFMANESSRKLERTTNAGTCRSGSSLDLHGFKSVQITVSPLADLAGGSLLTRQLSRWREGSWI